MSAPKRKKIVFVCTGNTCRSPMAEALMRARIEALGYKGYTVTSAGIKAKKGDTVHPKSAQVLSENGLTLEGFVSKKLTDKLVREAFAIVCMTDAQRDYLMDLRWNALKKAGEEAEENNVYSFYEVGGYEIPDPYGKDIECYRYVYNLLFAGIAEATERLRLKENAYQPKQRKRGTGGAKKDREKKKSAKEGSQTDI